MKVNVIGMILNNAGRHCFEHFVLDDNGKPLSAEDSLHTLIMEYAKAFNGGTSTLATLSRDVTIKPQEALLMAPAAQTDDVVRVPLQLLKDASEALGNFVSDHGWGDADMQAMDNLDACIAQHAAAHQGADHG